MSSKGESSRSKSSSAGTPVAAQSNICPIPADLSFVFGIRRLDPNYEAQECQTVGSFRSPPTIYNAYTSGRETLYRWHGGRVQEAAGNSLPSRSDVYDTASVFYQGETDHFVAVGFDVQTRNVRDYPAGWRRLTFDYYRLSNTRRTYSYVNILGPEDRIAAPGSGHWIEQLLPRIYDFKPGLSEQGRVIPASSEQAGLIGSLPLLLSLAAFSAPYGDLDSVMTHSMLPGAWRRHDFPSGQVDQRGYVVTVYLDRSNPKGSTRTLLHNLQAGNFGPFYGP